MKKFLLFFLGTCCALVSFGQSITVGNGTDRSSSPWQPQADYSYSQAIYLASEIATARNISSIRFYFDSTLLSSSNKLTVFVGHTTKSSFTSTADWVPLSGLSKVFDNTLPVAILPGWVTIIFTTPFAYNGTDNLVIAIDENQPGHETKGGFYSMNYTANRSLSLSSSSNIDSANPAAGVLSNYAANIRMVGLQGACKPVGDFSHSYSVSNGTNYATVNWKDAATGTTPTAYQYEVRANDTLPPGSANPHASGTTTTNSVTYSVLLGPYGPYWYRLYVRPVCSTGVYGPWINYMGGDCTMNTPYTEDFEGGNNLLPCISNYLGSWDLSGIKWQIGYDIGSYKLTYCSGIDPADAWFETPWVLQEKDSTYTFSYDWRSNSDDYFYGMGELIPWGAGTKEKESIANSNYTKMVFRAGTAGGLGGCVYIDNLKIKKTTCGSPKNVKITSLTSTTATIRWQQPSIGLSSSYSFTYFDGNNTNTINGIVDTFVNLTGLTSGKVYSYTLRATCTANDKSVGVLGVLTTPCLPNNLPYNQDFATSYIPLVPQCTQTESLGGKWATYNAVTGYTGTVLNYTSSTPNSGAWFYTAGLKLVAGTSYRLTFKSGKHFSSGSAFDKLEVKYGNSPLRIAMTNPLFNYFVTSTTPQTSTIIFTPAVTGIHYIGFYANTVSNNQDIFLDDINVTRSNLLNVSLFLDKNSNTIQDAGEPYFDDANIITGKTGVNPIVTHTSSGQCRVDIDTGNYTTTVVPYRPYYTTVPASHTSNYSTYLNSDTAVFALQPINNKRDLSVVIFAINPARPGFNISYQLSCKNKGTDTVSNAVLKFVKPHLLTFISAATPPLSVVADTLTWNISNLNPDEIENISATFSIPAPPVVNRGDFLFSIANISSGLTDLYPQDNISNHTQLVTGSYDPNDKTESHGGSISLSEIQNDGYLQYTIRFQNTGNDTAFNIYIRDTLSALVDINSLEMVSASTNYKLVIKEGNKLVWTFIDIKLVDSNTNEPASHGYIVYKVKPKANVLIGDIITNSASIYFDYNLPVKTNIDSCIVKSILPLKLVSFAARKKDKTNVLNWATVQEVNLDKFEIERSNVNSEFTNIGIVKSSVTGNYDYIDIAPPGLMNFYRLKMIDKDGKFTYSPVRSIDNRSSFYVTIQPNPSKNDFTMLFHGESNTPVQIRITDVNGKIVGLLKSNVAQNFTFGSEWAPGIYLVEARQGNEIRTLKAVKIK